MSKQKIVTNGMVALAIMLFVFMYFKGKQLEEDAPKQEAQQASNTEESENVVDQEHTHEPGDPHHHYDVSSQSELDQNVRPIQDAPEDERSYQLADFYTVEEIQLGKDIATQFAQSYYAFNGDDMTAHVKAIQPITEPEFYGQLFAQTGRATNGAYRAELINIEVLETYDQVEGSMLFSAFITGKVYGSNGALFEEQAYVYYIKLEQLLSELKVVDVRIVKVDSR